MVKKDADGALCMVTGNVKRGETEREIKQRTLRMGCESMQASADEIVECEGRRFTAKRHESENKREGGGQPESANGGREQPGQNPAKRAAETLPRPASG